MERVSKEERLKQVARVDELRATGMSMLKACERVGIKTPTYATYINKDKPKVMFTQVEAPSKLYKKSKDSGRIALVLGSPNAIGRMIQELF